MSCIHSYIISWNHNIEHCIPILVYILYKVYLHWNNFCVHLPYIHVYSTMYHTLKSHHNIRQLFRCTHCIIQIFIENIIASYSFVYPIFAYTSHTYTILCNHDIILAKLYVHILVYTLYKHINWSHPLELSIRTHFCVHIPYIYTIHLHWNHTILADLYEHFSVIT